LVPSPILQCLKPYEAPYQHRFSQMSQHISNTIAMQVINSSEEKENG
ncbi:unnamed protein product, partial [marine sediment metagenome]